MAERKKPKHEMYIAKTSKGRNYQTLNLAYIRYYYVLKL